MPDIRGEVRGRQQSRSVKSLDIKMPRATGPPVTAPDGMVVNPIDVTPCAHLALAEGDIQPGHTYGIHAHLTLEQVTYVLAGRIRAITHDPQTGETHETVAATGESVITLPGQSLQFAAADDTSARVLFITSPPYPADHSDTVTLDAHRPLNNAECALVSQRRDRVMAEFGRAIERPGLQADR